MGLNFWDPCLTLIVIEIIPIWAKFAQTVRNVGLKEEGERDWSKVASLMEILTNPIKKYDPSSFKIINIGLPTARTSIRTIFKL